MPIENWHVDEVWEYLLKAPSPWGGSNEELFMLYKGSNQGECPIVIDKTTPSCGNSRFGCWTCTVVNKDKAIHGLVESGEDWMKPLLEFRDELHFSTLPENKATYRNHKRNMERLPFKQPMLRVREGLMRLNLMLRALALMCLGHTGLMFARSG